MPRVGGTARPLVTLASEGVTRTAWRVVGVAVGPVVLAGLGLAHPSSLNSSTAAWWRDLHLILLPLFPLLAVNLWWLLGRRAGPLAWVARVAAFVYLAGYGALDVLSGIAAGALVDAGLSPADDALGAVFALGGDLARIGVIALLASCVLTSLVLSRTAWLVVLPGAVLLCGSALVFMSTHIYWPAGGLAQLGMAAGFAWLALVRDPAVLAVAAIEPVYEPPPLTTS